MNHCQTGETAVIKNTNCNRSEASVHALREHVRFSGATVMSRAVRFIGACLLVCVTFGVQSAVAQGPPPPPAPNDAGVCPNTLSQGGENTASANFILHDSIGGIGGVSQTSANFQSDVGYIPQVVSGCNCMTCDDFVAEACVQLQLSPQTSVAQALALLEGWLAGTDLFSVDICADGVDGAGSSESCSAFILQSFQADAGE
jgi:hypothetical protein